MGETWERSPYPAAPDPKTDLSASSPNDGEPDEYSSNTESGLGYIGQSPRAQALVDKYYTDANRRSNVSDQPARGDAGGPAPETSGIPERARDSDPPTWPSVHSTQRTGDPSAY